MADDNQPQQLTFNGNLYNLEDLTARAMEAFNDLILAQQKLNKIAAEVRVTQASQVGLEIAFARIMEEDDIQPVPTEAEEVEEDTKKTNKKVN